MHEDQELDQDSCNDGFCGIGEWKGTAEVYDGQGRFVGNGADQRHVRTLEEDGRTRIDLAFIGPLKFAGHYHIAQKEGYRSYEGPINFGTAESLGPNLVEANNYWAVTGLSQRFFLMVTPDGMRQMSLALLSRGDQPIYTIVGEYVRVFGSQEVPNLTTGTAYDLFGDPNAGRSELLVHRPGIWRGTLSSRDAQLKFIRDDEFTEKVEQTADGLSFQQSAGHFHDRSASYSVKTNGWQGWTPAGDVVGSYSLCGGRALVGSFHYMQDNTRLWRREVVSNDGLCKAVFHTWFKGGARIGVQHGMLEFEAE